MPEGIAKVIAVPEAAFQGNVGDGAVRIQQQAAGVLNADMGQIFLKPKARHRLKSLGKIRTADVEPVSSLLQREPFAEIFINIGDCLLNQLVGLVKMSCGKNANGEAKCQNSCASSGSQADSSMSEAEEVQMITEIVRRVLASRGI